MHHLFRRVPRHLEDSFDELPPYEPRVHDHVTRQATSPKIFGERFPELRRPILSESEAKARARLQRPPREVDLWLAEMLARNGDAPDKILLLWDPQMPRWSFWAKWDKNRGDQETGYARIWIVGEQEAKHRGKAVDLDERAEYYEKMGTMGPFRLPTKHEIDWTLGVVAKMEPHELDRYLREKQEAEEKEKQDEFDDFTMDYFDYRNLIDAWKMNDGIRTWCCQAGWTSEREKVRAALERAEVRVIDKGTHKVRVKRGGKFEAAALADLERESAKAKPEDQRDLEFAAKETRLGRVRLRRVAAAKKGRTL